MPDYVGTTPELNQSHVIIQNAEHLNEIINNLVEAGHGKLHIVSDFDKTITKQHENGKAHLSSFAIFHRCSSAPQHFLDAVGALYNKYGKIEIDPAIPPDEKTLLMEEWWAKTEIAFRGLNISQKEIKQTCMAVAPSLRDGARDFFKLLNKHNVPVLVFSAGLGDVVVFLLEHSGVLDPNVEVVSNFIKYDDQGTIIGFKDKMIHVYNKNEYAIESTNFYNKILARDNVILLGDSLGDAAMTQGLDHIKNVLKIGFLYEKMDEALPAYMNAFDIVLKDDQTMEVPMAILRLIDTYNPTTTELGENLIFD